MRAGITAALIAIALAPIGGAAHAQPDVSGDARLTLADDPDAGGENLEENNGGVAVASVMRYQVIVKTADIPDAGTNATIRIKVYGTIRDSPGYVNLDNDEDNFEPAKTDFFGPFSWFDIGRPDFVGVYKGSNGSNWAAQYVAVVSQATGRQYICQMDAYYGSGEETQWFDCS